MNGLEKVIKKSVKTAIRKKYKCECRLFWLSIIGVFYIEFLPCIHCPSIWNAETCLKINNILSQLCLAYIASFIFFAINIIDREVKKNILIYPHIIHILGDIFMTFASHKGLLIFISQKTSTNETFEYNINREIEVISALKEGKSSSEDIKKLSAMLCDNSIQLAKKTHYNIELLNHFSESFDTDFNSLLYSISQNYFILQFKDKNEICLNDYERFLPNNMKLHEQIELLRKKSETIFKIEFP